MANGNVPLPRGKTRDWFYAPLIKDALTSAEWIGASRGQIDEKKETDAAIARIKNGLSTYEIEIARLGSDWRTVFEQRAEEEQIIKTRNLNFTGEPVQAQPEENTTTADESDDEDSKDSDEKNGADDTTENEENDDE